MQISIQSPASLERRVEVTLPQDKVDQAFAEQLKGYQRKAKIPGFRPGKAPLNVIRKNFSGQIAQDLASRWMREGYVKAMEEGDFRPVGSPQIENVSPAQEGETFSFVMAFQVFPKVEAPSYDGFSLKKPVFEVADADVNQVVNRLRWNQATFAEKADAAELGDRVIIDFVGKVGGEAFEGGSAEGMPVVLGAANLVPGFEEQLVGITEGEERSIEIQFPEDYGNETLAGKAAVFDVTAQQVLGREIPPLDEELSTRFNLESVDALKAEIKAGLEEEGAKAVFQRLKEQVMDQLFEANSIELPSQLVESQISTLWRGFVAQQGNAGEGVPAMPDDAREQFEPVAHKMVALGLLVSAISEKESLEVTEEEAALELSRRAAQSGDPQGMIAWYQQDVGRMSEIKMALLEDKVTQTIIGKSEVVEESQGIGDLLPSEQAENQPQGLEQLKD